MTEFERGYADGLYDAKNNPEKTNFISTSEAYTRGYYAGRKAAQVKAEPISDSGAG